MEYVQVVRKFIAENFLFGDDKNLKDDTSFLDSSILDSTGILELVAFLEETYDITVEDAEMIPENMDSLLNISTFLTHKTNGPG